MLLQPHLLNALNSAVVPNLRSIIAQNYDGDYYEEDEQQYDRQEVIFTFCECDYIFNNLYFAATKRQNKQK